MQEKARALASVSISCTCLCCLLSGILLRKEDRTIPHFALEAHGKETIRFVAASHKRGLTESQCDACLL